MNIDLKKISDNYLQATGNLSRRIVLCGGTGCVANGALKVLGVDFTVAVTGIAGPGGGTPKKPVGLVYIAAASEKGVTVTENHFDGDREAVRLQTVQKALSLLIEKVKNEA